MKILMTTMGLDIGGAETHIVELSKALAKRGHKVLIASNGGVYVPEIEAAGIRHFSVPLNVRDIGSMWKSYLLLKDIITNEKPDVVHSHARIPGFICGALQHTLSFPFVTTAHWVFSTKGALRFLSDWGQKSIAVSDDIKQYLIDNYKMNADDIYVTINGVDTEKFSPFVSGVPVREEFGISAGVPVVAHVSRLDPGRELAARLLIEAAPALAEKIPNIVLLIAGGGTVFDELLAKAGAVNAAIGRDCIIMCGPRTDISSIVAAGDLFVGVSRAALEAMSAAKPTILAGNEGYLGAFIPTKLEKAAENNFCCRDCDESTVQALTGDILSFFTLTKTQRHAMGNYGREVIQKYYSVDRMADDALTAYHAALKPQRIVMSGYYGYGNAGDEAILESVLGRVNRAFPNSEVTVLSKFPDVTKALYSCQAVNRFNPFAATAAIRSADLLISGGGSLLQDTTSTRSLLYYIFILRYAQFKHKKTVLYANGIGPVTKKINRLRVKKAVNKADVITLRDEKSAAELRSMGVARHDLIVTADPVFMLDSAADKTADDVLEGAGITRPFVVISVRPCGVPGLEEKMARVADHMADKYGLDILFAIMQPASDTEQSSKVAALMTSASHSVSDLTPEILIAVFKKAQMVISTRLHALIFAARAAVPMAGIVYDPKVSSFLDDMNMPSLGSARDFDADTAADILDDLMTRREEKAADMDAKLQMQTKLALENESILKKMFDPD